MLKIAAGDEEAFRKIFYHYGPAIHPFVLNIVKNEAVAKEIIQEVFLRVWLKRDELPAIEKPSSWIYRIASNLALSHLRRQHIEMKVLQSLQQAHAADADAPVFDLKELQELIVRAVNQLPAQRQRIFKMSREEGLNRREIAARLNISENTVRNQLAISLRSIQEFIERSSGYYLPILLISSTFPVY